MSAALLLQKIKFHSTFYLHLKYLMSNFQNVAAIHAKTSNATIMAEIETTVDTFARFGNTFTFKVQYLYIDFVQTSLDHGRHMFEPYIKNIQVLNLLILWDTQNIFYIYKIKQSFFQPLKFNFIKKNKALKI